MLLPPIYPSPAQYDQQHEFRHVSDELLVDPPGRQWRPFSLWRIFPLGSPVISAVLTVAIGRLALWTGDHDLMGFALFCGVAIGPLASAVGTGLVGLNAPTIFGKITLFIICFPLGAFAHFPCWAILCDLLPGEDLFIHV